MKTSRKNQGFTLIELVIVIIILGILSATAVSKFISLRSDAVLSSMESLKGVIRSADQLVYLKAAISNMQELSSATITIDGTDIAITYGYPAGTKYGIVKVIENNADDWNNNIKNGDWHSRKSTNSNNAWVYWHGSYDENAGSLQCYIRYNEVTVAGELPIIEMVTNECN